MYVRKYKHEPSALLEELNNIDLDPDDLKFNRRVAAVSMVLRGEKSTAQAADEAGCSVRSVQDWLGSVDKNGWDSLRSAPALGRPTRLSAEQLAEVKEAILGDPAAKGYSRWTSATVAAYIRNTYQIEYGTTAATYLIRRLGLRPMLDERASAGSRNRQQDHTGSEGSPQERPKAKDAPQDGAKTRAGARKAAGGSTRKRYSNDPTQEQYEKIRPLLESVITKPGSLVYDLYDMFCGCLYIVTTGAQWKNLPGDLPDWGLVYHYWELWSATDENGVSILERCMVQLVVADRRRRGRNDKPSLGIVDSKSVKNADTARTKGFDAGKKISGIKVHIVTDTNGSPWGIHVTPANTTDRDGAIEMIARNLDALSDIRKLLFDGGYTGGEKFAGRVHELLPNAEVEVVKRSELHTFKVLPMRWIVERTFAWLEKYRRLWKNCERELETSRQMTILAIVSILLKRF